MMQKDKDNLGITQKQIRNPERDFLTRLEFFREAALTYAL